jgi:hypothetical protein
MVLAVKERSHSQHIQVGDYVVLHSLQKRPDLVGRVGRVTSSPAAAAGTGSKGSSSSSSGDAEAR